MLGCYDDFYFVSDLVNVRHTTFGKAAATFEDIEARFRFNIIMLRPQLYLAITFSYYKLYREIIYRKYYKCKLTD